MEQISDKNDIAISTERSQLSTWNENSSVILPEKKSISTDDNKFYAVAVKSLPSEIQFEVEAHAKSQATRYSRWEIFLCIAISVLMVYIAYSFIFPSIKQLKISSDVPIIPIEGLRQEPDLYEKINQAFTKGFYEECINLLPPDKLQSIISDKEKVKQNTYALSCYLNAVFKVNCMPEVKQEHVRNTQKLCNALVDINPDYAGWHLHKLCFDNYDLLSNNAFMWINAEERNGSELERLQQQVKYMESINTDKYPGEVKQFFDIIKCKIYIACWLHYLPYDDTHLQRPNNSNGLRERLAAYDICAKYENNLEMLLLREFIIKKIKDGPWSRKYFFNNEHYWHEGTLNSELQAIDNLKKKLQSQED